MAYQGMTRIDLGPMRPYQKSIRPVCQTIGQKQKNGMECKVDTNDGESRLITAFDDNALLDIMNAATRSVKIRRVLALSGTGSPDLTKLSFTALNENPEYGIGGDPLCAALSPAGDVVKKAIWAHGRRVRSGRSEMGGREFFLMDLICGKIPVSLACLLENTPPEMKSMDSDDWVKASGFGDLMNLKVNGRFVWRVYIDNLRHFRASGPESCKPMKISPEKVISGIEKCGFLNFDDDDIFGCF